MATVHKSYWIDADLAQEVAAYADAHGIKTSAAASALMRAGLEAESGRQEATGAVSADDMDSATNGTGAGFSERQERPQEPSGQAQGTETHTDDLRAVCEALRASNAALREANISMRETVSTLTLQLHVKDEQIQRAHELLDQSHKLQAAQMTRALPDADGTKPSIWTRIFGGGR